MAVHPYKDWNYLCTVTFGCNPSSDYCHSLLKVYWLEGMRYDFKDIRFATLGGTDLPFYMQSKTNSKFAVFTIKIPANTNQIEMFFGKRDAAWVSNPISTFDFYYGYSDKSTAMQGDTSKFVNIEDRLYCLGGSSTVRIYKTLSIPLTNRRLVSVLYTKPLSGKVLRLGFFCVTHFGEITHLRYHNESGYKYATQSNDTILTGGSPWGGKIAWDSLILSDSIAGITGTCDWVNTTGYVAKTADLPLNTVGLISYNSDDDQEIYALRVQTIAELTNASISAQKKNTRTVTTTDPTVIAVDPSKTDHKQTGLPVFDLDQYDINSITISRSINDPYWVLDMDINGNVPMLPDMAITITEKDHLEIERCLFSGVLPDRSDTVSTLAGSTTLTAYSHEYLLQKTKIDYTLTALKMDRFRGTWRIWINSLLSETPISIGYFDLGLYPDTTEIDVSPLTSKLEAIHKIRDQCKYIFYCEFNNSTDTVAHFIDPLNIDDPDKGLKIPQSAAIEYSDILGTPKVDFDSSRMYNRVRVRGYNQTTNTYLYGVAETEDVAAKTASIIRDGFEHNEKCKTVADCRKRADLLLSLFRHPIIKIQFTLERRFDLQLYQKIVILGNEDMPEILADMYEFRIIKLTRTISANEKSVTVEAVQDLGIEMLMEFKEYFDDSIVQSTQNLIEEEIKRREEKKK